MTIVPNTSQLLSLASIAPESRYGCGLDECVSCYGNYAYRAKGRVVVLAWVDSEGELTPSFFDEHDEAEDFCDKTDGVILSADGFDNWLKLGVM